MNQIVLGAAVPFAVAIFIYLARGARVGLFFLVATPLTMAFGAVWAVVPDIPRLLGNQKLYFQLMRDPRTDIFLFHFTIDQMENDSAWWGLGFLIMALALLAIGIQTLKRREHAGE